MTTTLGLFSFFARQFLQLENGEPSSCFGSLGGLNRNALSTGGRILLPRRRSALLWLMPGSFPLPAPAGRSSLGTTPLQMAPEPCSWLSPWDELPQTAYVDWIGSFAGVLTGPFGCAEQAPRVPWAQAWDCFPVFKDGSPSPCFHHTSKRRAGQRKPHS